MNLRSSTLISLCWLIEVFCHFGVTTVPHYSYLMCVIYLLTGIAISMLALRVQQEIPQGESLSPFVIVLFGMVVILGSQDILSSHLARSPIDFHDADMLPVLQTMAARFLSTQEVYAIIPWIWDGMQPIYLPAFWMPYCLTEVLDMDMRWVSIVSCWFGLLLWLRLASQQVLTRLSWLLTAISTISLWSIWMHLDFIFFTLTQEGLIVGYLSILCAGILLNSRWLTWSGIFLCLMSRYSIVPWMVAIAILSIWKPSLKKYSAYFLSAGIVGLILLFAVGALPNYWTVFADVPGGYQIDLIANPEKYAPVIQQSLGVISLMPSEVYKWWPQLYLLLLFVIPISFLGSLRLVNHGKTVFGPHIILGCLKLSLTIFYSFLIIPYHYLFYPSTCVTVFLILSCERRFKFA
ncbi:MAG: hypothetical protein AAFQ02_02095 [Bacteroidota bacterium]